jgi:hypothetical protein
VPSSVGGFARRVEVLSRRYSSAETSRARSRPYLPIATGAPPRATRSTNWLRRLRASLIRSGVVIVYLYKNVVTTSTRIDEPSEARVDSLSLEEVRALAFLDAKFWRDRHANAMTADQFVEFHVFNSRRSRRAGIVCENAEVTESIRSHSDDGVCLFNDYDFSTQRDYGTRAFCGHRKSLIRGRSVFVLTYGNFRSIQQTRSQ